MEPLTAEQLRVLAVLVEKEATTPDLYPLTLNGLLNGCNQLSNRNPVVSYSPEDVEASLASLRERKLVRVVHSPSNRAEKFRHVADEAWELGPGELAVLAVLALRGPQTENELRTRTERYAGLEELGGVEGVLHRLKNRYAEPYVVRLERRPGQREERWAHLLAGEVPEDGEPAGGDVGQAGRGTTPARVAALETELAQLQVEVAGLRSEVAGLHAAVERLQALLG